MSFLCLHQEAITKQICSDIDRTYHVSAIIDDKIIKLT